MMPRLLVLTDRSQLPLGRSLLATLTDCVRAGAIAIVVRELDLPDDHRDALAAELSAVGATVIAARRPLPHASGLHLPAIGPATAADPWSPSALSNTGAATTTPRNSEFGRSCHSRSEVEAAVAEGAAWAMLSPYAASASKPGHGPPVSREALRDRRIPVYALGGIDEDNAAEARAAGAYGVAVMGAVMSSGDPARTVTALLEAVAS